MDKRLALMPLLVLAVPALSGCVAAAIPALAGAGVVGSRLDEGEAAAKSDSVMVASRSAPAPAPAPSVPAAPAAEPVPTVTIAPAPKIVPAPVIPPAPMPPEPPARAAVAAAPAAAAAAPVAYPDPNRPLTPEQASFARFVRYGQASALGAKAGVGLPSAVLSDPVALDGKRRSCVVGEQLVVLIDLDPAGSVFTPPANPEPQPGLALGLSILREAGLEIAWLSDLPVSQSGALRSALEQAGFDPRGQDIISLRRDDAETKQQRRDSLAGISCIVAIAGDERPDFDERFKYLRNPEAGAGIEPLIGDGWFLIEPLLGK